LNGAGSLGAIQLRQERSPSARWRIRPSKVI
jgi:hypothetical protein